MRLLRSTKSNANPGHFLLAQICEMQHKPDAEAAQLREYLKSATDPQDVAMVKNYLADLTENFRR